MTKEYSIGMVSLGCDKNRVDSEMMLGALKSRGFNIVNDERQADVIIINTCGFIDSAKQESIDTILEMSRYKQEGKCRALIASGCLAERYSEELLEEIPELDAVVGVGNFFDIESVIKDIFDGRIGIRNVGNKDYNVDVDVVRVLTTPSYTAYIKIAEGCNNSCSYCAIPGIRGIYRSRSKEKIISEVRDLADRGVKEFVIVAQDTTKYGIDLYGKKMLVELIRDISLVPGVEWIRLLYCYPEDIDDGLITEIKDNDKVCKYLDIPIQHISSNILKSMRRLSSEEHIKSLIQKLRKEVEGIVIRTTLITGFPGETEKDFELMYDFLRDYKLDRVGIFLYSREEGTDAAEFENQIDEKVMKKRQKSLLTLQKKVSRSMNNSKVGNIYRVLIEGVLEDGFMVGRTYADAPGIDGVFYVKGSKNTVKTGEFVYAKVTEALDYDLIGEVSYESGK